MEPLVIYHHIPKTGGTSVRQLIQANYGAHELVDLDRGAGHAPMRWHRASDWESVVRWHRDYYGALPREERGRIRCFVGHSAPFLLPAIADRCVQACCMLRDPVELVLSHYLFTVWQADELEGAGAGVPMLEAMRSRGWSLKDAYRELGDTREPSELHALFLPLFNSQARHVLLGTTRPLELPFTAGLERLERHRDAALQVLSGKYVVGTQDRFSESMRLFADTFGWRTAFVPRVNVGRIPQRAKEIDDETRSVIREYNAVDVELHRYFSQRLAGRPAVGRLRGARGKAGVRVRRGGLEVRRRVRATLARRSG